MADLSGFRRAAARLNTTQPNISSRIAALEARLGYSLMRRDAGAVRLTPRGEALLPHARRVLRALDDFGFAAGEEGSFEGALRLGVTELVPYLWLGDFMKAMRARFPRIVVDLSVDRSTAISQGLADRSLDLAIQNKPFEARGAAETPLGAYRYVWVAAPDFPFEAAGAAATLEELTAHTIVTHARGTAPYEQFQSHLRERGATARLAPCTNLAACLQLTLDGLGLAFLPEAMAATDLARGALRRIPYDWTPEPLAFAARFDAATAPEFVRFAAAVAADVAEAFGASEG